MKMEGTVTAKGQLVIPAAIRRRYRIHRGTRIRFEEVDGGVLLRPITYESIDRVCGILAGKGLPDRVDREPDREIE